MFVGREKELHFLEERYASAGGELIVVYGRRRVGKTETLRKFCEGEAPRILFLHRESGWAAACRLQRTGTASGRSGSEICHDLFKLDAGV